MIVFIKPFINATTVRRLQYYLYFGVEVSEEGSLLSVVVREKSPPTLLFTTKSYRLATRSPVTECLERYGGVQARCLTERSFDCSGGEKVFRRVEMMESSTPLEQAILKVAQKRPTHSGEYSELLCEKRQYGMRGIREASLSFEDSLGRRFEQEVLFHPDDLLRKKIFRSGTALAMPGECYEQIEPLLLKDYYIIGRYV